MKLFLTHSKWTILILIIKSFETNAERFTIVTESCNLYIAGLEREKKNFQPSLRQKVLMHNFCAILLLLPLNIGELHHVSALSLSAPEF